MSGVLIVLLSSAAKVVGYLHMFPKEYTGIAELHGQVSQVELLEAVSRFTGEIYQRPPLRSSVSRRLRVRKVHRFDVLEFEERRFLFTVRTDSGTYIRKLIHDVGTYLGVGAHMAELRRTIDGPFSEDTSFNLLQVAAAAHEYYKRNDPTIISRIVQPVESVVARFASVYVKDSAVAAICHGAGVAVGGVSKFDASMERDQVVAVKSLKGELIGMGRCLMDSESMLSSVNGMAVRTEQIVMDRHIYPRKWR